MQLGFEPRSKQNYNLLHVIVRFVIFTLVNISVGPLVAETNRETQQVRLDLEKDLRRHLLKLERWRVSQLLRTEQELDNEQKRRANTSTNAVELELLSDDEDVGVRFLVAANRHASHSTLNRLAVDNDPSVRSGVAMALSFDVMAPKQTQSVIEKIGIQLARDSHVLVRINLASNEKLSEPIYFAIAKDPDYAVRKKLAENTRLPPNLLEHLAKDSVDVVQAAALIHRNIPSHVLTEMATHPNLSTRLAVGENNNVPVSILDLLAQDTVPSIRRLVASHPKTELSTLNKLVDDVDQEVVLAIAKHPNADRRLLMTLAYDDRDGNVRIEAQNRLEPLLRREIREDILERWKTDNTLR